MLGKYWAELPKAAKLYMVYHALATPLLFAWWIVPYLMLKTGLTILNAGLFYSIAQAVNALITYFIGRFLDRYPPNLAIALSSLVEAPSYIIYFYAFIHKNPIFVLVGVIVDMASTAFYPGFAVYEYGAYPEEIREKAFAYHNILPYLSQAISYPLLGYVFGVMSSSTQNLSLGLLAISVADALLALYPLKILPILRPPTLRVSGKPKPIPKGFYMIAITHIIFIFSDLIRPMLVFVNLFIEVYGGGLFEIGIYEAIFAIIFIVSSIPVLRVGKKRRLAMILLGFTLFSLGDITLILSKTIILAFLASIFYSVGGAIMSPYYMDVLFSNIPSEIRGTLLGSLSAIGRILRIVTPTIAGFLATLSPQLPYLTSLVISLLGLPTLIIATKQPMEKNR